MWRMLQQDVADDYVLGTGVTTPVRKFVEAAGRALGMHLVWKGEKESETGVDRKTGKTVVRVNPKFYRPAEVELLLGDPAKAKANMGWSPTVGVDELAEIMAKADFDRVAKDAVRF